MAKTRDGFGIFVAPYANPLAGEWTDAADAVETFAAVYKRANGGDVGLMDYELPGCNELTQPETVVALAEAAETHGIDEWRAFVKWDDGPLNSEGDVWEASRRFEDSYRGQWDSDADYAYHFAEACMEVPEGLWAYLDFDAIFRDLPVYAVTVNHRRFYFWTE